MAVPSLTLNQSGKTQRVWSCSSNSPAESLILDLHIDGVGSVCLLNQCGALEPLECDLTRSRARPCRQHAKETTKIKTNMDEGDKQQLDLTTAG